MYLRPCLGSLSSWEVKDQIILALHAHPKTLSFIGSGLSYFLSSTWLYDTVLSCSWPVFQTASEDPSRMVGEMKYRGQRVGLRGTVAREVSQLSSQGSGLSTYKTCRNKAPTKRQLFELRQLRKETWLGQIPADLIRTWHGVDLEKVPYNKCWRC